jgi:DNA-directed RNA polymerase specialized sigma24 family protein
MGTLDKLSDFGTRERVTRIILDFLEQLPEPQRRMFIWSHYQGLGVSRIAENMHCSNSEVEGVLRRVADALASQAEHTLA